MSDNTLSVAEEQFRAFFERWQRLEEDKRAISDDLKELFAEMKGNGYDTKAARAVFRDEVSDKAAADEFEAICDLYRAALRKPRAHPAPVREKTLRNSGSNGSESSTATNPEQGHVGATNSPDGQQGSGGATQVGAAVRGSSEAEAELPRMSAPAGSASDEMPATISPDPHLPLVDGGQPDQSLDDAGAKSDGPHSIVGQGGQEPGIHSGKSGHQSASAAQDRNGPVSASGASAAPFNNPRCQHSDTCHYAHSENACHECLLAWASRPRDEQVRLWAEARAA